MMLMGMRTTLEVTVVQRIDCNTDDDDDDDDVDDG